MTSTTLTRADTADTVAPRPTVSARASRRPGSGGRALRSWGPPLIVLAVIVGAWYLVSDVALGPGQQFLLPAPDAVIRNGFLDPSTMSQLMAALGRTAFVTVVGLAIAAVLGIVWAVVMSQARWVERSLFPYAVILQCVPILALVPLIGFWFGFQYPARIIVCVMIAVFPMVSNTLFGLQAAERGQRELFQLQHASRWTTLWKLLFPGALPAIFAGLRISAGLSVVGAVVGDFFFRQGDPGLGALISNFQASVLAEPLFATILLASLFGVVIFLVFSWIGRLAVGKWHEF
jgi:NitT/TauT family transport system permease protein